MSTTFISGYDGSAGARAALRFTTRLATAVGAEVLAVNVYPAVPAVLGKGASAGALHELRDEARSEAHELLGETEPAEVTHLAVAAHSPAEGLHDLAAAQHAALVAVGGTHHGVIGRVVVGSVGEKLLHGSPSPVVIVPPDTVDKPIETISVAFDAREESHGALLVAKDLADRLGARLQVIAIHEPRYIPYAGYGAPVPATDLEHDLAQEFEELVVAETHRAVGEDVEIRVSTGSAPRLIASLAGASVDLLITGSRGYGAVRGVVLGSISRYLVDHAPCPVLVVPRGVARDVLGGPTAEAAATA